MHAPEPNAQRSTPAAVLALVLLGAFAVGGWLVLMQVRMAPGTPVPVEALAHQSGTVRSNDMRPVGALTPAPGPGWETLSTPQKLALYPLAERWAVLSELQKHRWLAVAQSFPSLPAPEQDKLHERMTEWASLSAQQRSQARLNYAVTNKLAPDNKREQWEAYQALSAEEKRRLAAGAVRQSKGAATALRPVPARKLVQVPAATAANDNTANLPKIPPGTDPFQRPAQPLAPTPAKAPAAPLAVETAPIAVPIAVPAPLPPLAPASSATEPEAPVSPDTAAQYSH